MTGMVSNPENFASWEQMADATGRIYLADRTTGSSKWLWQKWDLNGKVFCVNILTNERKWPSDMDMKLKVAAGMTSPAEMKAASNPIPAQPQHHNNAQFPGGQRSYSSIAANGSRINSNNQQLGATKAGGSFTRFRSVPQHQNNRNSTYTLNNSHNQYNTHAHGHQQPLPHQNDGRMNASQTAWAANNSYNTHNHQGASFNSQMPVRPQYGGTQVGNSWVNTSKQQHPYPRSSNPHNGRAMMNNALSNAKHGGHQNYPNQKTQQHGRFWQPQNKNGNGVGNGNNYTNKFQSKRSAGGVAKKPTNKYIFRAKPTPIPSKVLAAMSLSKHRRHNNINSNNFLTSAAAQALMEAAKSLTNTELISAMHARDFTVNSKGKDENTTRVTNFTLDNDDTASSVTVVGLCEDIEKDYLRLTSAPVAELVRPPRILKLSLSHVKNRWISGEVDYDWVCRQMKSMRQDYKVQHIETLDSLETYETHARLALENGDLGEFNTCVAQAQELFKKVEGCSDERMDEFAAYRILYNVVVGESNYEQARLLASFTTQGRERRATKFALDVRASFLSNNYSRFFKVCAERPTELPLLAYLLYRLIPTMRSKAVAACVTAYAPARPGSVPLEFFIDTLAYNSDSIRALEAQVAPNDADEMSDEMRANLRRLKLMKEKKNVREAAEFLRDINAVVELDEDGIVVVDCKACKAQGIRVLDHQIGLITHAGGK